MKIIVATVLASSLVVQGCVSTTQRAVADLRELRTLALADIDTAISLATYNDDQISLPCWRELRSIVVMISQPGFTVGAVTATQVARDLLGPRSRINLACAALKEDSRRLAISTIANIGTLIASGGTVGALATPTEAPYADARH